MQIRFRYNPYYTYKIEANCRNTKIENVRSLVDAAIISRLKIKRNTDRANTSQNNIYLFIFCVIDRLMCEFVFCAHCTGYGHNWHDIFSTIAFNFLSKSWFCVFGSVVTSFFALLCTRRNLILRLYLFRCVKQREKKKKKKTMRQKLKINKLCKFRTRHNDIICIYFFCPALLYVIQIGRRTCVNFILFYFF